MGLALTVALAACQTLPPPPPGGAGPDCSDVAWGSLSKAAERMSPAPITGVRAGQHHCFDRFVIDLRSDPAPGWRVRYGPIFEQATGTVVPVRGGASLEIVAEAPTYDRRGVSTYDPPDPSEVAAVWGFRTFRQAVYAGSFEGRTTFGLGLRARLPFRVFALEGSGGTRLVIDVAHHWS